MELVLCLIILIIIFAIIGLAADAYGRNTSYYPKISFDEFLTLYNAYKEEGKRVNLYSCEADVDFGKPGPGIHYEPLYLSTWKDRIKFHRWRKAHDKQMRNEKKEQILAEVRKEVGSSPEVPADVYEAILNDLKKKYGNQKPIMFSIVAPLTK